MSDFRRKDYPTELRAVDDAEGTVEAIVSVFGNVDLGGDRVVKGAFAKTIDKWSKSGFPVPVVWSHKWDDLWSHIGTVTSLEETDRGLKAVYTLDIDTNPAAAQAYRLMQRGAVKEHSFAYQVIDERQKNGVNELLELDIIEVGPTLKGMNPETELLAVKSALEEATVIHSKAGRTLSKANESKIRNAVEALTQVLSSLGEEEEKADEAVSGKSSDETEAVSDLELLTLQQQIESLRSN